MWNVIKTSWPTGLLALFWTGMPAVTGILVLAYIGAISDELTAGGAWGWVVYVLVFVVAGGLGLLPTYAQAVVAGWVFGAAAGLAGALLGFAGAAWVGFAVSRLVSQDRMLDLIRAHPKAEAVRYALVGTRGRRTAMIIALLRIPPNSPFALTNLAMASAGVALRPFLTGTILGMIPRTAVAVLFAASAAATGAHDIQELVQADPWLTVAGVTAMIVVLVIIGRLGRRALKQAQVHPPENAPASQP